MKPTDTLKPRDLWDRDDLLDFLDGWHEASDVGFKAKRDHDRQVSFVDPHAKMSEFGPSQNQTERDFVARWTASNTLHHPAGGLIASGRSARDRHRQAEGI